MKNNLLLCAVFALAMFSCKKNDVSNNSSGSQLLKVVSTLGSDSTVTEFTYDGNGRFIVEKTTVVEDGSSEVSSKSIVRDASGRAKRVVESVPGFSGFVDYTYLNPTGSRVRNGLLKFDFGGIQVTDSIAFQYATKVSKTTHYYSLLGSVTEVAYYIEYAYDGKGNMTQVKFYQPNDAGDITLSDTYNYEYDDKVNPVYFNDDVLVEYVGNQYVSPNNLVKINVVSSDPSQNFKLTNVYEYGADGRPVKMTTSIDGGATYQSVYTYKK